MNIEKVSEDVVTKLLEEWQKDCEISKTDPHDDLLRVGKLHAKYLTILSSYKVLAKKLEFRINELKKVKFEYYAGRLDQDELKKYGWKPFQTILKSEIGTYIDADEDVNALLENKTVYDAMIYFCESILKEINNRSFQIRSYMEHIRYLNGN